MKFKKSMLTFLVLNFVMSSCETDESEVFKDVISYNEAVFHKKVSNCTMVDKNASCANKTESYIVACDGSDDWYKWEFSSVHKNGVVIYTIPKNYDNYQCNPLLDVNKEFKAYDKSENGWELKEHYELK